MTSVFTRTAMVTRFGSSRRPPLHTVSRQNFVGAGVPDGPLAPNLIISVGRGTLTPPPNASLLANSVIAKPVRALSVAIRRHSTFICAVSDGSLSAAKERGGRTPPMSAAFIRQDTRPPLHIHPVGRNPCVPPHTASPVKPAFARRQNTHSSPLLSIDFIHPNHKNDSFYFWLTQGYTIIYRKCLRATQKAAIIV